jgi:hypothetical protein
MVREEGLEVENPTEALVNENVTFKLISPSGYVFRVSCRKGRNMQVREMGTSENVPFPEVAHHDRFDGSAHQSCSRRWQIETIE